jgi:hypothetical protein
VDPLTGLGPPLKRQCSFHRPRANAVLREIIVHGSPENFDLIAKNEKALPWLSLGQNIQFILDKTIYEVYAADISSK